MPRVRIEALRDGIWTVRASGYVAGATAGGLAEQLPAYALQYPHRAFLDDVLVAEVTEPAADGTARVVRHRAPLREVDQTTAPSAPGGSPATQVGTGGVAAPSRA